MFVIPHMTQPLILGRVDSGHFRGVRTVANSIQQLKFCFIRIILFSRG